MAVSVRLLDLFPTLIRSVCNPNDLALNMLNLAKNNLGRRRYYVCWPKRTCDK